MAQGLDTNLTLRLRITPQQRTALAEMYGKEKFSKAEIETWLRLVIKGTLEKVCEEVQQAKAEADRIAKNQTPEEHAAQQMSKELENA